MFTVLKIKFEYKKTQMKTKNKKSIVGLNLSPLKNTNTIKGGNSNAGLKVINVGNSIVDDLNGLIR